MEAVHRAANADAALGALWASKEAAYKVLCKQIPGAAFVPRRWFVDRPEIIAAMLPGESAESRVHVSSQSIIFIRLSFSQDHVHCLASDEPDGLERAHWSIERLPKPGFDPSPFVRHRLISRVAAELNLPAEGFDIVRIRQKGELAPPVLLHNGVSSGVDITLSHDGRFAAFAYLGRLPEKAKE